MDSYSRPAGMNELFTPAGQKEVTLGPLFRAEKAENRACVTKTVFIYIKNT